MPTPSNSKEVSKVNHTSRFSPRSARNQGMLQLVITVLVLGVLAGVSYFAFGGPNTGKTSSLSASAALNAVRGIGVAAKDATSLALSANLSPASLQLHNLVNTGGFEIRQTDKSLFNPAAASHVSAGSTAGREYQFTYIGPLGALGNPSSQGLFLIVPGVREDICTALRVVMSSTATDPLAFAKAASDVGPFGSFNTTTGIFDAPVEVDVGSSPLDFNPEFCVRTADNNYAYAWRVWSPAN